MSTIRILLGIICFITFCCCGKPNRGVLAQSAITEQRLKSKYINAKPYHLQPAPYPQKAIRNNILKIAISQIGVREATGKNDGEQVEAYLEAVNLAKGHAWCAAFVSWVFKQVGYKEPRTAWSPAMFPLARLTRSPQPADVLGIYSSKLKRIAHCGLIENRSDKWITSIEGNTNSEGGREGDGVYRKRRHIRTITRFADWVSQY